MKKVIKSRIFLIIVLCIISCGIGVYAANTYKASDVLYTSSDGTSMTVNDALNDLYNLKSNNINYEIGVFSATVSKSWNWYSKDITFTKKFNKIPKIYTTENGGGGFGSYASKISEEGFTYNYMNFYKTDTTDFNWIAIEI